MAKFTIVIEDSPGKDTVTERGLAKHFTFKAYAELGPGESNETLNDSISVHIGSRLCSAAKQETNAGSMLDFFDQSKSAPN